MINLILDYDGTLHNSAEIYIPGFLKSYEYLVDNNLACPKEFLKEDIVKWLGYSASDMWNRFMPSLAQNEKEKVSSIIGDTMIELIKNKKAKLYDGAEKTLSYLKNSGYNLIFLSNCKKEYMDIHTAVFGLDRYFTEFHCSEDYEYHSKPEIFQKIKSKHKDLENYIIIGDRFLDMQIAVSYSLPSIGCSYGFGSDAELASADVIIDSVTKLPDAVKTIENAFFKDI